MGAHIGKVYSKKRKIGISPMVCFDAIKLRSDIARFRITNQTTLVEFAEMCNIVPGTISTSISRGYARLDEFLIPVLNVLGGKPEDYEATYRDTGEPVLSQPEPEPEPQPEAAEPVEASAPNLAELCERLDKTNQILCDIGKAIIALVNTTTQDDCILVAKIDEQNSILRKIQDTNSNKKGWQR